MVPRGGNELDEETPIGTTLFRFSFCAVPRVVPRDRRIATKRYALLVLPLIERGDIRAVNLIRREVGRKWD